MSTITRELAKLFRKITNSEIDAEGNAHVVLSPADSLLINNARIALASLEAEAVGEVVLGEYDDCGCHPDAKVVCIAADGQADWENFKDGTRLYTAPPAPASVPDGVLKSLLPDAEKSEFWFEHDGKILFEGVKFNNAVFDACRAVMLQGADGNSPVIPDGWVACSERMPEDGEKVLTSFRGGMRTAVCKVVDVLGHKIFVDELTLFNGVPADHWQPLPAAPQQEADNE
ncbi:DUF551 domain-containing protein [Enterobacter hormaechei]|uniref:DUF551 domain-containing protein n=1 Tax=Enterobacter hormaechei TaxID=158836 RepID=UPI001184968D|nr:DUF551 domain-containing protein [Enterobacter hormaechei]TSD18052.1 DUF551 domain-containing protein [Enterobacter hormaechei]TSD24238.1 DUF551 domain-containing protein [Enterobacter hormaechei]